MAIVPTATGPSVESRPVSLVPQQAQFTPESFGAGVGQAVQNFGTVVGKVGTVFSDIDHQNLVRSAKDADTEGRRAVTAAGFKHLKGGPEGNQGYFSMEGQAALDARPIYEKALQDIDTEILGRMTDSRVRGLYESQSGARRVGEIERSASFSMQQGKVADIKSDDARIAEYADALSLNFNDPKAYRDLGGIVSGVMAERGRLAGWTPEQLAHNTKVAVSKGYSGGVLSALASGDVAGAAKLFQTYAPQMDTASRLQLAGHLEAPVRGAVADADIARRMTGGSPAAGGDASQSSSLDATKRAIHLNESGGAANAPTSLKGAVGGRQIMPGTFAQYAKPGERIDNPEDNAAVGDRIVEDLFRRFGGDPERVAVGYFSGPGNVSEPGSPTAWKVDKHDGKKFTSDYVADVNRRMSGPLQPPKRDASDINPALRHDFARIEQDILNEYPPGKDRDYRLSRLHAEESRYDRSTQASRDEINKTFRDKVAAAAAGNDTTTIDETAIRHAYRAGVADYMIQEFRDAVDGGQIVKAVALASPEKLAEMRKRLTAPLEESDVNFAKRARLAEVFENHVAQRSKMLDKDPAAYALNDPQVLAAYKAMDGSPERTQTAIDVSLSTQRGLGVAEPRVLTDEQAKGEAKKLRTSSADAGGSNPDDLGARLDKMRLQYGEHYNKAWADVVQVGKLDPAFQALAVVVDPGARANLQRAMQMRSDNPKEFGDVPYPEDTPLRHGIDSLMWEFGKTTIFGGQEMAHLVVRPALVALSTYYVHQGLHGAEAVTRAYKEIILDKYDIEDSLRVPKDRLREVQSAGRTVLRELTAADLETGGASLAQAREGRWGTNPQGDGVVLMAEKLGAAGFQPVRDLEGNYISMKFNALPKPKPEPWFRDPRAAEGSLVNPGVGFAPRSGGVPR